MKKILLYLLITICTSCLFDRKHKDVNPFYTTKAFGDMPLIPLLKPVKLSSPSKKNGYVWWIDYPYFFKPHMAIDSIFHIGVDKTYVYGKIHERRYTSSWYTFNSYVFVDKYNTVYVSDKDKNLREDEIQIYPIDSINKIFMLPERWFVINVADSTTEAFFSKSKYLQHLKERRISGRMYNIDSIDRVFTRTGILPWFPDSIKVKLSQ